jgi:electron transport complex protein RnfE
MKFDLKRCGECACLIVTRNPVATRMIGLCPLLAVSSTAVQGGAIAVLFGTVMLISATLTSILRNSVIWRLQPLYHALVAAFSTAIAVALMSVVNIELIEALGIYPLLIAGNCLLLSTIQEVAERSGLTSTLIKTSREIGAVIIFFTLFGAVREFAVYGALLTDSGLLFQSGTASVARQGLLPILGSPPGAILLFALVLAAVNAFRRPEQLSDIAHSVERATGAAGNR